METDTELSENASYALQLEAGTHDIKIAVEHGWLTLTGGVRSEAQKAAAEKAVFHIRGIRGIRNYIAVLPPPKPVEEIRQIEAVPMPQES
jgi:osmotically-inducible protein OsmY